MHLDVYTRPGRKIRQNGYSSSVGTATETPAFHPVFACIGNRIGFYCCVTTPQRHACPNSCRLPCHNVSQRLLFQFLQKNYMCHLQLWCCMIPVPTHAFCRWWSNDQCMGGQTVRPSERKGSLESESGQNRIASLEVLSPPLVSCLLLMGAPLCLDASYGTTHSTTRDSYLRRRNLATKYVLTLVSSSTHSNKIRGSKNIRFPVFHATQKHHMEVSTRCRPLPQSRVRKTHFAPTPDSALLIWSSSAWPSSLASGNSSPCGGMMGEVLLPVLLVLGRKPAWLRGIYVADELGLSCREHAGKQRCACLLASLYQCSRQECSLVARCAGRFFPPTQPSEGYWLCTK